MTLDMERGPQTIEWGFVDRWVRLYVNVSSTFLTTTCPEPVLANRRAAPCEHLPHRWVRCSHSSTNAPPFSQAVANYIADGRLVTVGWLRRPDTLHGKSTQSY